MALVITAGAPGDTGDAAVTGPAQVIAAGVFGGATVRIEVEADLSGKAVVWVFKSPGSVVLQAATGTTVTATVSGGGASTAVNVSVI